MSEKIIIGTSGFTYPASQDKQPRKGENLYGMLSKDIDFNDCSFVASGRGWPVRTMGYKWPDMPKFYQSLDIYVCTSLIEGIGYGPLEAMACGVPVVIPKDVGIFDELPNLENVHRYTVGDYNDLKRALLDAINNVKIGAVNVPSLIAAVSKYTHKQWVDDHTTIFENFLYGVKTLPPKDKWLDHACIFYTAYGEPALECVTRAIISAKKYLPQIPVVLASNKSGYGEDVFVYHDDTDIGARSVKTQIYELAPKEFEYVLYLDADTEVVSSDVKVLFDFLEDGWAFVICINPAQYVLTREMARPDNKEEMDKLFELHGTDEMLQLNGGVFAFRRNERTEKLMNDWYNEWNIYGKRDQAALDRTLFNHPVKMYVLGNEWNTITRYLPAERTAGILHYPMSARRWKGRIEGRLDAGEAWGSIMPTLDEYKKWNK